MKFVEEYNVVVFMINYGNYFILINWFVFIDVFDIYEKFVKILIREWRVRFLIVLRLCLFVLRLLDLF